MPDVVLLSCTAHEKHLAFDDEQWYVSHTDEETGAELSAMFHTTVRYFGGAEHGAALLLISSHYDDAPALLDVLGEDELTARVLDAINEHVAHNERCARALRDAGQRRRGRHAGGDV